MGFRCDYCIDRELGAGIRKKEKQEGCRELQWVIYQPPSEGDFLFVVVVHLVFVLSRNRVSV